MKNEEMVVTAHPARRTGIRMSKKLYTELVQFIVESVRKDRFTTSLSLMTDAEQHFPDQPNLLWYLMHAKLDLEANGMIHLVNSKSIRGRTWRVTEAGVRKLLKEGVITRI